MNKKLLIAGAVLICLLAVLYFVKSGKTEDNTGPIPQETTNNYSIINADKENVEKITVRLEDENVEYYCTDDKWLLNGVDNSVLNLNNIDFNVSVLLQLNSAKLITDAPESLESYGLETPTAVITVAYKDGSTDNAYLGDKTSDGNYYYITNDNNSIYTIDKINGDRICYTPFDFVNLSMDTISSESVTLVDVKEGDKELYIEYDSDDENANENLKKSGVATLSMRKPIENLLVYPNNLQSALLYNLSGIKLNGVAEIAPENLSDYGLDDPQLIFKLADLENMIIVYVGNEADEDNYYVRVNERNAVYTMSKEAIEPFRNYSIVDFIQKFIALHTRSDVAKITIESIYGDYTVDFRTEGNNAITEEDGSKKDNRNTYINDVAVDRDNFTIFYELIAGLAFDELQQATIDGDVKAVITYELMDGTKDIIHFYNYNDNFFVADKGENSDVEYNMLISKQRVKQVVDKAGELSKQ